MTDICFYFQVHQPYRLKKYQVFDIGKNHDYFNSEKNEEIMKRVSEKCYIPTNKILLENIKKHDGKFKVAFSITGVALEQFEKYSPEVIDSFKELVDTGCVELIAETYYHSLSFVYSKAEFERQLQMHVDKIKEIFGITPKVFRNTELIFNNELAEHVSNMGFSGILAEGADHVLGWKSPNYHYGVKGVDTLGLLLKNYKLSDDIAFRFSNAGWEEYPLSSKKYLGWLKPIEDDIINLFMDYETFGEHQWEESGIFDFLKEFPTDVLEHSNIGFVTPSEAFDKFDKREDVDMPDFVSWADAERDLSAWLGNPMQDNAIGELFAILPEVMKAEDEKLLQDWSRLTTSDHFYYMCTKWFNDGDVHKYFNPYDSPYESFIAFMNVLNDMIIRVKLKLGIESEGEHKLTENPSLTIRKR